MTLPSILVSPAAALIDIPRDIVLTGFSPSTRVTVSAAYTAADTSEWRSHATFTTDASGTLDLGRVAPDEGTYSGADASGLIWSLALVSGHRLAKGDEEVTPRTILLEARDSAGRVASAEILQIVLAEGVVREPLQGSGIVGTVFRPADMAPRPVVVVLNGSGGGINEARAALYAAHGYIGIALGYFNAPGLPSYISDTPLDYFTNALRWIKDTYRPVDGFIALQGHSRGAELSLLLGSLFPAQVSAVLAYVPSNVVHGTLRAGRPGQDPQDPAWIHEGKPLTTVWADNTAADWSAFNSTVSPVTQAPSFVSALLDPAAVERAAIPVERIRGPVLLVSATDDGFWPSTVMADAIARRREHATAAGSSAVTEHLRYEGAGHAIQFPYVPTTRIVKAHAVAKVDLSGGGTPAANAFANADSWPRTLQFLERAVAAGAVDTARFDAAAKR